MEIEAIKIACKGHNRDRRNIREVWEGKTKAVINWLEGLEKFHRGSGKGNK